jgi:hypothetical protein
MTHPYDRGIGSGAGHGMAWGAGNFNPLMKIDTSHASLAPPPRVVSAVRQGRSAGWGPKSHRAGASPAGQVQARVRHLEHSRVWVRVQCVPQE